MCNLNALQQKIFDRTKEGDMIAKFLVDTMQGQHTDAKFNHRMDAAKHLFKYGFTDTQTDTSIRHSREGGNPEGQGGDETPVQSPLPGETCLPLRSMSLSQNKERARVRGEEMGMKSPLHRQPP